MRVGPRREGGRGEMGEKEGREWERRE